jgi:hypothetical protein
MKMNSCPVETSCSNDQFELDGRCFENDRKLDYIRCYNKHRCGSDSKAICDTIGCESVLCDFDSTEIINLFNKCGNCNLSGPPIASLKVVGSGVRNVPKHAFDYDVVVDESSQRARMQAASASGSLVQCECPLEHTPVLPPEVNQSSLSEIWKTLANKKQKLVADFILPGSNSLIHEDGTEAAFESIASDFSKRDHKKRALIDLPLRTAYEDVCCSSEISTFPDVITPEFVIAEFSKQINFSAISCETSTCGPPPR